ncbi:MAG: hypothetical protein ONB13_05730 [candidate division KSB1 bacterium]|nr:hypothetical protein [candidate division KSB1 bacterium]MDZ7335156.1 hypothetical protein [candidate division KSB1 bacterium]MDZ7356839.1 hypothetical protein [candidate division KSB1 bacterium]MDZ7376100.1 hypothetical protein [candidate division KSB1 bacterium]MDZ7401322.1 hypothetical protein [candidate division KSB1 bacterium]
MNLKDLKTSGNNHELISRAIDRAIDQYIQSRREKVPKFVNKHFSLRGALRLHKKVIGSDLYKGPLNISWSVPYSILRAGATIMNKAGKNRLQRWIEQLPPGFETNVQKEVKWLIYTELLELPYQQGERRSTKDALLEAILQQPESAQLMAEYLVAIAERAQHAGFRQRLEQNLMEYATSRTAAADLAGTIITLSIGAAMFKQMTPGAMATGSALATAIAHHIAVSNFILGPTLGSLWYSLFPVSASFGLVAATTGAIMAAMSLVTSFAGIVTDPIQAKLGIHQRRLYKFLECLEKELKGEGNSKLELKAVYVARIFDIIDILKTAATTK